jgi:hypothetical protein
VGTRLGGDVRGVVETKITAIEAQIRALEDMRSVLLELASACPGGDHDLDECPILDHLDHAHAHELSLFEVH